MTSKPAARVAQASLDETTDIKSPKQHTRELFAWLDHVMADSDLPHPAFKVAYVIGQHVNRQSGEAWPSTDTIASRAGLAQSSVRDMVERLHQRGHLDVTWGSRGRGHPNKYRLTTKERTAAVLEPKKQPKKERTAAVLDEDAKERFRQIKERSGEIKERRSAKNNFITTLTTKKERAYGPRSSDASLQSIAGNDGKPADDEPLKLIPRAAQPRGSTCSQQHQPCRVSPEGRPPASAAPAEFDMKKAAFDRLKLSYPPQRVGNEVEAYRAFCAAMAARRRLSTVVEAITDLTLEYGAEVLFSLRLFGMLSLRRERRSATPFDLQFGLAEGSLRGPLVRYFWNRR